jgi:hypothetical protein
MLSARDDDDDDPFMMSSITVPLMIAMMISCLRVVSLR